MERAHLKKIKGVTLLELILVIVIISIGAALAIPSMRAGVEHKQARAALDTLRSFAQAVRMYEVNEDILPIDLSTETLITLGYLSAAELAPGFNYSVDASDPASPIVSAVSTETEREITLQVFSSQDKANSGEVTDSEAFLGDVSVTAGLGSEPVE